MTNFGWAIGLLVLQIACGNSPLPAPTPPSPAAPNSNALKATDESSALYAVAPSKIPSPPWLDSAIGPRRPALGSPVLVSVGMRAAVARSEIGWLLFQRGAGVRGPVAGNLSPIWMGLNGSDELLISNRAGTLFLGKFSQDGSLSAEKISENPGAIHWDIAGSTVAAGTTWDEVWISKNGGRSFKKQTLGKGLVAQEVFARYDGVVVARGLPSLESDAVPETFVGSYSKGFQKSAIQPINVFKKGSWLWADADCPKVLSKKSPRWVTDPSVYNIPYQWAEAFQLTDHTKRKSIESIVGRDDATFKLPRPPSFSQKKSCEDVESERDAVAAAPPAPAPLTNSLCRGIACLTNSVGPRARSGSNGLSLFAGGNLAVYRKTGKTKSLPSCEETRVLNALGLSVVLCETQEITARTRGPLTTVFVSTNSQNSNQEWIAELKIREKSVSSFELAAGPDGTIGLYDCDEKCTLWIRPPIEMGENNRWTKSPPASFYHLLDGGRWLAGTISPSVSNTVSLSVYSIDSSSEKIVDELKIPATTTRAVFKNRNLHFVSGTALAPLCFALRSNGSLVPVSNVDCAP